MTVGRLLARRVLLAVPLIWAIMTLTFFLLRLAPGDPVVQILGDRATGPQYDQLRHQLGLDRPMLQQYLEFIGNLAHGEVGKSLFSSRSATAVVLDRMPATLSLAIGATILSVLGGIAAGVYAALRKRADGSAVQVAAIVGQSVPDFWLGLVLIGLFAVHWNWLPANGFVPFTESLNGWALSMVLPVVTLGLAAMGSVARMTRAAMISALDREFIRTLRANGVSNRSIVFRHALKNAAIPVTTLIGVRFIGMLSSAVIVEQVFALPGVGTLAIDSASNHDYPVMQALVLYLTVVVVAVNVIVDVVYSWLNPKVRLA
ncbi:ABC transporter permease [Dactylosporangium sp. NPDC051484]|uniref:ABC transporter permease n=1 Tax=Dactylosporangium sp. NPDC051484 TaxID=3154942 RepID=UPI00344E7E4C